MYRMIVNLAKVGMHEEAIEYVERSKSQALVELLSKEEIQPKGKVPPDIIEEYEKVIIEYKEIKFRLLQATRSEDSNQLAEMKYRFEEVKKKLDTSVAKIKEYDHTFIPIIRIEPIEFATIEKLIPKDNQTALIEFFVTDRKTLAFIVIPGRRLSETTIEIENFKLSDLASLLVKYDENGNPIDGWLYKYYDFKEKMSKYYENVSAYDEAWHNWKNVMEDMLRRIYEGLFKEIDKTLKNLGIRRLILIPHRGLNLLPLHAMFRENDNKREYLIDDYEFNYGPSSQIVELCQRKKGRLQESLLAVANPDHTLRYVDNEIRTIAEQFDRVEILWYERATKSAVFTYAPKCNVLHFGCHGYFNPVDPMSSGLILADEDQTGVKDGKVRRRELTLAEIFRQISLPLTSLVVLSACETGMAKLDISDEYIGLSSGFLYAGSPAVIGSLWAVDDLSTALLISKFFENLCSCLMKKTDALNDAQRWLRNLTVEDITKYFKAEIDKAVERILDEHSYKDNMWKNWDNFEKLRIILKQREYPKDDERVFCHPYYWAAFFISGNGF